MKSLSSNDTNHNNLIYNKVLIITEEHNNEDDHLTRLLMELGIRCVVCSLQEDIYLSALRGSPDLIMMEITSAPTAAWRVMDRLQQFPQTRDIPVAVVGNLTHPSLAYEHGATLYFPKPLARETLLYAFQRIQSNQAHRANQLDKEEKFITNNNLPSPNIINDSGLSQHQVMANYASINPPFSISNNTLSNNHRFYQSVQIENKSNGTSTINASVDLQNQENNPRKPLILVAEDSQDNIDTIVPYLAAKNFEVIVSQNGKDCLIQAQQQQPDLILMDIQMPQMDGFTAIQHLRNNPLTQKIPIIAVTALAMQGDRERCLAVGASDYIAKPIRLKQLIDMLHWHLSQKKKPN